MFFLTSLGNSKAQVKDAIASEESVHPYLALKKAELFINQGRKSLEQAKNDVAKREAKIGYLKEKYFYLSQTHNLLWFVPILGKWLKMQASIVDAEVSYLESDAFKHESTALVRDAIMEMRTGEEERARILAERPDFLNLTYEQIQDVISPKALFNRKAMLLASRTWSSVSGLPESVSQMLFESCTEEQKALYIKEMEMRANLFNLLQSYEMQNNKLNNNQFLEGEFN